MNTVQRLQKKDGKLIDAICESLKSAYDPEVSKYFVHQDEGYKRFFHSILDHPAYATYYSYDSLSAELNGFACFQVVNDIVFLKHIVVDNRLRGNKIGTKLLHYSLRDMQRNGKKYDRFQLHVFEKNSKALSWYLSIGMEIIDCAYWYDLFPTIEPLLSKVSKSFRSITINADTFGFRQVNYKGIFVGTLLAEKTFIVKNSLFLKKLNILASFIQNKSIKHVGFVSDSAYDLELVDKALLMNIPIKSMKLP
ncbi:MAG TPA: GNAT family N-acetyltransferase [Pseudosphingobacterium sp.]|nr:GNAT family N-acetyltransferase [Pseudosphingobacterium sp.]